MIPKFCKRLAEVDFPIAEVSQHAVREKSIRQGHPSTLHLRWARRPLASCRTMLFWIPMPGPTNLHRFMAAQIGSTCQGCPRVEPAEPKNFPQEAHHAED